MATRDAPLLSVPQFAAREGVSRIRVLQLLAARRIAGAHKIGHRWAIPAGAALPRRRRGRPRKGSAGATDRLLRAMARKYIWWLPSAEALARPDLVVTQVMEMGDYDDVLRVEAALGRGALVEALRRAEPGRLSARSWTYWHHRLGLAPSGRIPPLPRRSLR
jgi:hypothetical protein